MKMTLDSLNRTDLLNLLNTICQKEQRSSDLRYQYVQLNNSLSNFRPKKSGILYKFVMRYLFAAIIVLIAPLAIVLYMAIPVPDDKRDALFIASVAVTAIIIVTCLIICYTIMKKRKKRKNLKFAKDNKENVENIQAALVNLRCEYSSIDSELRKIYDSYNVEPEHRNKSAMSYLASAVRANANVKVFDVLRKYDEITAINEMKAAQSAAHGEMMTALESQARAAQEAARTAHEDRRDIANALNNIHDYQMWGH